MAATAPLHADRGHGRTYTAADRRHSTPDFHRGSLIHGHLNLHRNFHHVDGRDLAEIAGCFAFWAWLRLSRSVFWLLPGSASLILFAYLLTLVETDQAGRAYAAYGGIYIITAICWLWLAEGVPPDRWDLLGAGFCLVGASVNLLSPHRT